MEEIINNFIRDVTSVVPRPKGEVRERLNAILTSQREEIVKELEEKERMIHPNWKVGHPRWQQNTGYNIAIKDAIEVIKKKA